MLEKQFEAKYIPNRALSPDELLGLLENLHLYLSQVEANTKNISRRQRVFHRLGLSLNQIAIYNRTVQGIEHNPITIVKDDQISESEIVCLSDPEGDGGLMILQPGSWGDKIVNFQLHDSFITDSFADFYQLGPNGLAGIVASDIIAIVYLNRLLDKLGRPRIVTSNVTQADNRGWFTLVEPGQATIGYWFKLHKIFWAAKPGQTKEQVQLRHPA